MYSVMIGLGQGFTVQRFGVTPFGLRPHMKEKGHILNIKYSLSNYINSAL